MIVKPHVDWFALSPSLSLTAVAFVLLLVAVLVPKSARKPVAAFLAFAGFAGSFALAVLLYDRSGQASTAVHDAIFRDRWAALAQVLLAGSGAVAVLISYREKMREEHIAEYYALLTAAGAGMAFFVQASNLMTLFLGLEGFSIAL
jgi:NADH-quinone oxidoreductase subunit N